VSRTRPRARSTAASLGRVTSLLGEGQRLLEPAVRFVDLPAVVGEQSQLGQRTDAGRSVIFGQRQRPCRGGFRFVQAGQPSPGAGLPVCHAGLSATVAPGLVDTFRTGEGVDPLLNLARVDERQALGFVEDDGCRVGGRGLCRRVARSERTTPGTDRDGHDARGMAGTATDRPPANEQRQHGRRCHSIQDGLPEPRSTRWRLALEPVKGTPLISRWVRL
jgi:hypothetical protein